MLVFPDLRLQAPKWFGQNVDPGGLDHNSKNFCFRSPVATLSQSVGSGRESLGEGSSLARFGLLQMSFPTSTTWCCLLG